MKIIKRNGTETVFQANKIERAIEKANASVPETKRLSADDIKLIAATIQTKIEMTGATPSVEEVQDMVVNEIMRSGKFALAQNYITYRYQRALARRSNTTDDEILTLLSRTNEEAKQENSNKDPIINSTLRDYIAGYVSRDLTDRILLPGDVVDAHKKGIIHFHDSDYYAQPMYNCCLVNLEDMLQNGTVISGTKIVKPHSFATACNIATQVIAQVASNQYGGQSVSLAHLAPFVDVSRQRIKESVIAERTENGDDLDESKINHTVERRLAKEVKAGVQTIQYQLITLMTTNGQAPFVTLFMYLDEVPEGQTRDDLALIIREVLEQRIKGVQDETGAWITPAFPKLIYALDEDNITEDSKYWDLTVLAAKCTAKRMVPDYISVKVMKELKGDVYTCMGCRSFLTPDRFTDAGVKNVPNALNYQEGKHRYYGRFNQGVVTINLPYIACLANGDEEKFWEVLDDYLELCHRALRKRHERLLGTPSDVSPILWQYGALARLEKGEKIDKLLYGGYSTISLGYAGLYECVMRVKHASHTSEEGKPFAVKVMKALNDACAKWKKEENIDYSVYGTPLESTTYKFAKALKRDFGVIEGVSDKNYITNSYHVHVTENIDAFQKLSFEADFQALSPGGAISYVEVPNLENNLPAVIAVMKHIYNTIMYAELNTKSDYCDVCGYDKEIRIIEDGNKLIWECPNCGNRDQNKMHVARRTCGYIGTQYWNQGRTQEIKDRVLHMSNKTLSE